MISKLVIIIIVQIYSILTIDYELSGKEENILYEQLQTQSNLSLFYETILQSNDIDDITRIHRVITQDDIQQLNFEDKVKQRYSKRIEITI